MAIERTIRAAERTLPDLPEVFRFHHLPHGSATTTLNDDSPLWPDRDEQARTAVGAVLRGRWSAEDQRS